MVRDATGVQPRQAPKVVLFVNGAGETVGTAAEAAPLSTTGEVSSDRLQNGAQPSSPGVYHPPSDDNRASNSPHPVQGSVNTSRPAPSDAEDSSPSPPSNSPSSSKSFGISYAPYRGDHQCKSKAEISRDFERFGKSYSMVCLYGTDCDQVGPVRAAAKAHGMKAFLGIWDPAAVNVEAKKIIDVFHGDWGMVDTVSVGNEPVNSHKTSPDEMARAVSEARSVLRQAGYQGPVVTVDTFLAYLDHPELGQASDYCAINAHAFFDSTIRAPQAGRWLQGTVNRVESVCAGSKRVVVTETGWPTKGDSNGNAVPGLENQRSAMDSIKQEFAASPGDVVLFSAFNDLWKKRESATFNADQYWGIDGAVSHSDS